MCVKKNLNITFLMTFFPQVLLHTLPKTATITE